MRSSSRLGAELRELPFAVSSPASRMTASVCSSVRGCGPKPWSETTATVPSSPEPLARFADQLVDGAVEVEQCVAERIPGLVEVLPQPVLGEVGALEHRDHHLGPVRGQPVADDSGLALDQPRAVRCDLGVAHATHVVAALQQHRHAVAGAFGEGVVAGVVGERESGDHGAVDLPGRVGHGHGGHRHGAARPDQIPDRRPPPPARGDEARLVTEPCRVARRPRGVRSAPCRAPGSRTFRGARGSSP